MKIYRIINITNELGIRDVNYNKTLDIEYLDNFSRIKHQLKPRQTMYLVANRLELTVEKLKMKGHIIVDIIDSEKQNTTIKVSSIDKEVETKTKRKPIIKKPTKKQKVVVETKENEIVEK